MRSDFQRSCLVTHTHTYPYIHTHTHIPKHPYTHPYTYPYTHKHPYTRTHTYTHTQHTHTPPHTHTHLTHKLLDGSSLAMVSILNAFIFQLLIFSISFILNLTFFFHLNELKTNGSMWWVCFFQGAGVSKVVCLMKIYFNSSSYLEQTGTAASCEGISPVRRH